MKQTLTIRTLLFGCMSLALLTGCTDVKPGSMFDDYLTRVARVQNAATLDKDEANFTQLPRKRDLYVDIPPLSIGLLDSYQLRQCGLFSLIAEKNSVLGKVADEFRNYDYQRALLDGLSRCLSSEELDQELKLKLADIERQKRPQLRLHQWNLIFSSEAMQKQLRGTQWLNSDIGESVRQVNQALSTINLAFVGANTQVVDAQEALEKEPVIGELNYSLQMATLKLNQVTAQLSKYDHRIICAQNRDTTKFKYLNNVFEQQYVTNVQPYMAQLDSYYQTLSTNLNLFTPQPDLHSYVYPLEKNHNAFRLAIRHHVDYWQQLFKRCGRKIG